MNNGSNTFTRLRLSGPRPGEYAPGEPIDVYHGRTLIGRVNTVSVSVTGNEVRIEDFVASDIADLRARGIASLIMAEVLAFVVRRYPAVNAVGIVLSRDIEGFEGRQSKLASARSDILQRVGADRIRITPQPHAAQAGHFAVSGIWEYTRESLDILKAALEAERAAYRERLEVAQKVFRQPAPLRRLLARLGVS